MHRPGSEHLGAEELTRLQDLAERFEQAWQQVSAPNASVGIDQFLPPPGDPLRLPTLHVHIKMDLEFRARRGLPFGLEEYLAQFPELGTSQTLAPALIYEEYRVRHLHGDRPDLSTYQQRFPAQFEALQRLTAEMPLVSPTQPEGKGGKAGQDVVGRYRLIKRIGSGGFGEVWRAEAPGGIEVAVKLHFLGTDREVERRLQQVLEMTPGLRHPFLLLVHTIQAVFNQLLIVMELASGSLRDRLQECRKAGMAGIPLQELLAYFVEAAEALDYLHAHHVLHRAVKPDNILLMHGHAKVTDVSLGPALSLAQHTGTATATGTPDYMAPEVWRGKVSLHSDQYALACTYAELRLGRRLFDSKAMMDLMFAHLEQTPNLDPLPQAEQAVLLKALAKDPEQRFPSCLAFAQALRDVGGSPEPPTSASIRGADGLEDSWPKIPGSPAEPPSSSSRPYLDDNVQFTVYRPRSVEPEHWHAMLAFAHLDDLPVDAAEGDPDPIEVMRDKARQLLGEKIDKYVNTTHDSRAAVPREGEITFVPVVSGFDFNPARSTFLWQEPVHWTEFRLRARPELEGQTARGTLTVFLGSILLAEIPLSLRVRGDGPATPVQKAVERVSSRPYRKIFASYSRRDAAIVEEFERYARVLGDTYLRDTTHLRAGEVWNKQLEHLIDEADVFQLFWSWNSLRSEFVHNEWRHALALGRPNFVRPTYWEEPLPAIPEKDLPPEDLRRLHFQRLTLGLAVPPTHPSPAPEMSMGEQQIPVAAARKDMAPPRASLPSWRSSASVEQPLEAMPKSRRGHPWLWLVLALLLGALALFVLWK